jgi:RNA polymerase sigma factor (sigma-70 family)
LEGLINSQSSIQNSPNYLPFTFVLNQKAAKLMLSLTTAIDHEPVQEPLKVTVSVTDAGLIEACLKEDRAAQAQLYKKYYGAMMAVCMRYLGNRDNALEVLNNAFLKVFRNLGDYAFKGSFEGWIKRIVYHCALDYIRQNAKYSHHANVEELPLSVEATVMQKLYVEDLLSLLAEVPLSSRTVFNMYVLDGYKHDEIAKELGISSGTSKWHLSEARRFLKQKIEEKYGMIK